MDFFRIRFDFYQTFTKTSFNLATPLLLSNYLFTIPTPIDFSRASLTFFNKSTFQFNEAVAIVKLSFYLSRTPVDFLQARIDFFKLFIINSFSTQ